MDGLITPTEALSASEASFETVSEADMEPETLVARAVDFLVSMLRGFDNAVLVQDAIDALLALQVERLTLSAASPPPTDAA